MKFQMNDQMFMKLRKSFESVLMQILIRLYEEFVNEGNFH